LPDRSESKSVSIIVGAKQYHQSLKHGSSTQRIELILCASEDITSTPYLARSLPARRLYRSTHLRPQAVSPVCAGISGLAQAVGNLCRGKGKLKR
jgi:hypothetical protein